jgi:hypothetical protein
MAEPLGARAGRCWRELIEYGFRPHGIFADTSGLAHDRVLLQRPQRVPVCSARDRTRGVLGAWTTESF